MRRFPHGAQEDFSKDIVTHPGHARDQSLESQPVFRMLPRQAFYHENFLSPVRCRALLLQQWARGPCGTRQCLSGSPNLYCRRWSINGGPKNI